MEKVIKTAPVIGFVRYSQKIKFGRDKKMRDVFEPEYFEYRFEIFKKITVESFRQQTNKNFVLLILHSRSMPTHYKERFLELEKSNSFLQNVFVEDTQEDFNEALARSIENLTFENGVGLTFRIDNDDAVQNNFIDTLARFVKSDFIGFAISLPTLYILKRITQTESLLEELYFPANAIGLAYVTNKENYRTVFQLGDHDLVNNLESMILLPKVTSGGLLTINGENAINALDHTRAQRLNNQEINRYLAERKIQHIDWECLKIFTEPKRDATFYLKKITDLLVPPIFYRFFK